MVHDTSVEGFFLFNSTILIQRWCLCCRIASQVFGGTGDRQRRNRDWEHVIRERDPNLFLAIASNRDRYEIQKHHTRFIEENGGKWEDIVSNLNYERGKFPGGGARCALGPGNQGIQVGEEAMVV